MKMKRKEKIWYTKQRNLKHLLIRRLKNEKNIFYRKSEAFL